MINDDMYDDIFKVIKSQKNILFIDYNKKNMSSHILQILLSSYDLKEMTIIDKYEEKKFIERNFKINDSIEVYGYNDYIGFISAINAIEKTAKQSLLVCHYSKINGATNLIKSKFNVIISVFDKKYEINNENNIVTVI